MPALFAASAVVRDLVNTVFQLYIYVLVARALLSWFPMHAGSPLLGVVRVLDRLTEPLLAPIRRLLPPVRAGAMAIDLSIIIAILFLIVAWRIVASYL